MYVIRPVNEDDLHNLERLAFSTSLGITSLPKDKARLAKKHARALESFQKEVTRPTDELYLFMLENIETKEVGGVCGILSKTGVIKPSYFYTMERDHRHPHLKVLKPISHEDGPSEICALYLLKEFRQGGVGKLLSFSRFLFMASHLHRFDQRTIAEMRGVITRDLHSPFWSAVGKNFINISFYELMCSYDHGELSYEQVFPEYPLYVDLLPKNARSAIGKTHTHTTPALKMLLEQGFYITEEVDLFDAGPKIEAPTLNIDVIKNSHVAIVQSIKSSSKESQKALISNTHIDFRATQGRIEVIDDHNVNILKTIASTLNVQEGDMIRYYPIQEGKP